MLPLEVKLQLFHAILANRKEFDPEEAAQAAIEAYELLTSPTQTPREKILEFVDRSKEVS